MKKNLILKQFYQIAILISFILGTDLFLQNSYANQNYLEAGNSKVKLIPSYRLGPGDKLYISVFKIEGYTAEVEVLPDGTINLPRLEPINVWGSTIGEVKSHITKKYQKILRNPIVYIDLKQARDLNVMITGSVKRPGIYSLANSSNSKINKNQMLTTYSPTLTTAIQSAGGVTPNADINSIDIIREVKGKKSIIRIKFLDMMKNKISFKNPLIYDGDKIVVNRAIELKYRDFRDTSISSLAPTEINVDVIGEVASPATLTLKPTTTVTKAILTAGGFTRRSTRSFIYLYRTNMVGKTILTKIRLDGSEDIASKGNTILRDNDVVLVLPNSLATVSDTVKSSLEPIAPIVNATALFKLFGS